MTLPEFSSLISDRNSKIILDKCFEECAAIYYLLSDEFNSHEISISIDSSKVSKGKCRFIISPISKEVESNIITRYKSLSINLFERHLHVKTRLIKNNNLSINIDKK